MAKINLRKVFLIVSLLLCLGLAAQAGAAEPAWQLEYRISGGFVGMSMRINLDADGRFRHYNEVNYKLIERKLLPAQLGPINEAVLALAAAEKPIPPAERTCNDCIHYELILSIDGREERYRHLSGMDTTPTLLALIQALQPLVGPPGQ